MRGLLPVYLVQCLFLLYSLFLCVAYAVGDSFDKKGLWRPYTPPIGGDLLSNAVLCLAVSWDPDLLVDPSLLWGSDPRPPGALRPPPLLLQSPALLPVACPPSWVSPASCGPRAGLPLFRAPPPSPWQVPSPASWLPPSSLSMGGRFSGISSQLCCRANRPHSPQADAVIPPPSLDGPVSTRSGRPPVSVPTVSPPDHPPGASGGGRSCLSAVTRFSPPIFKAASPSRGTISSALRDAASPAPRSRWRWRRLRLPPNSPGGHHARFRRLQTMPLGGLRVETWS
jgi:hypothetical protein